MYSKLLSFLILFLFIECSDESTTDSALLKKDKIELEKNLTSSKVSMYRFGKIIIRASAANENEVSEIKAFESEISDVSGKLTQKGKLSVVDYITIYRNYSKMKSFVAKTDEDKFPTLVEALNKIYSDSARTEFPLLKGNEKIQAQNVEHAILSAVVLLSSDLGKEIALYECSKTNPKLMPDSEAKTLLQFIRGFLFFEKKLLYLSEDELSDNINWLNKNPEIELPYTKSFFQWQNLSDKQTHVAFHSFNHLFRGFDRLMMDRKIDEERALEDFEVFLADSKKLGLENEVVWSVESYLYVKKGDKVKAILALNKLKTSKLLSANDKKAINESIGYLKNRDGDSSLNNVYDKVFLSKIATKYMLSILSQIDWEKVIKEQNVPHTEEIFETVENLKNLSKNLKKYSSTDVIKENGMDLFKRAKDLTE